MLPTYTQETQHQTHSSLKHKCLIWYLVGCVTIKHFTNFTLISETLHIHKNYQQQRTRGLNMTFIPLSHSQGAADTMGIGSWPGHHLQGHPDGELT